MIRILHLSDFHYKDNHDADFKSVSSKIAEAIQNINIDIVVFSGDLVFDTNSYDKIEYAAECFIEPIKTVTGLDNSRILIAPGNHDMKRNAELPFIHDAFSRYETYQQIDEFCKYREQLQYSLANFENYNAFVTKFYKDTMIVEPLYTYGTINVSGKKIGLIAFNSAWRSTESKQDRGHLVYPVYMVHEAFDKIGECDLVLCTQHHNLSDYTDNVCQQIEEIVNEKCHVLFTGHYHRSGIHTSHDSETGLLHLVAPATYNRGDGESKYGFSILEIDEETLEGNLITYAKNGTDFIEVGTKPASVPVSEVKKQLNEFRKLLKKRQSQATEKADALFVSGKQGVFNSLFKNPIIKNKSVQEILTSGKEGEYISLEDIVNKQKSTIIFGYNKKGKSSLLRKIEIDVLGSSISRRIVPYFIDYKNYRKGLELNLSRELHNYLEMNYKKIEEIFTQYTLLLLIDDFNPNDNRFIQMMNDELKNFPNAFFIATSIESLSKQCALINFEGTDVDKYYIHDITNKEVHQLTLSWPNIAKERKREIEEKIMQISKNMHLSLNYWTVSLFLWIFEKTDNTNIHNNFELVKLYIDELLGKENFIKSQFFHVEYDDLKSYLAALAEKILYSENYSLTEKELEEFTYDYREHNLKFNISTFQLVEYLLESGVIYKIEDKYTIRLKGVFEFLLAFRMCESEELKTQVLSDKHAFLSFGNELEYYAGFKKNDYKTIETVFNSAKKIMESLTSRTDYEIIDKRLDNKVVITEQDVHSTGNLIERLKETTGEEEQYEMLMAPNDIIDETGLKTKVYFKEVPINSTSVESILFILSRIYRNSNVCNHEQLAKEILDYILTGTCNLGFLLVDETRELEIKGEDNAQQWIALVSNFIPIILEAFLYDAISQRNLAEVFKRKLAELKKTPENNQLRIFLLTLILVDIDITTYLPLIEDALELIDNKILRFAILNKNVLLTIKYYDNKEIKEHLLEQRKGLTKEFRSFAHIDKEVNRKIQQNADKDNRFKAIMNADYK